MLILLTNSYSVYLLLIFLNGFTLAIRIIVTYPHLMECMPPSLSSQISNYLFFLDGLVYMITPVILMTLKDTKWLLILGAAMNVVALIGLCVIKQDESVRWCLTKEKYK